MNLSKFKYDVDKELEEAVKFLVFEYSRSGHNTKPVIFHSIKVAMYLYDLDYETYLVKAALLHDLVEDTKITVKDITEKFGDKIGEMVKNLSFKSSIPSKVDQYIEMFDRTKSGGKDLLIIKCADIYQNSFYIGDNLARDDYFIGKIEYFLKISKDDIKNEKPWIDLNERLEFILKNNVDASKS